MFSTKPAGAAGVIQEGNGFFVWVVVETVNISRSTLMDEKTDWFQLQIGEQLLVGDIPGRFGNGSHKFTLKPVQNGEVGTSHSTPDLSSIAPSWAEDREIDEPFVFKTQLRVWSKEPTKVNEE